MAQYPKGVLSVGAAYQALRGLGRFAGANVRVANSVRLANDSLAGLSPRVRGNRSCRT